VVCLRLLELKECTSDLESGDCVGEIATKNAACYYLLCFCNFMRAAHKLQRLIYSFEK